MSLPDPAALYRQAVDALNRSDWTRAYWLASSLLPQCDDHGGVHFVAGVAALHLADNRRAHAHLQRAVRLSPTRPDYLAQLARVLATARATREGLEAAERAVALGPSDPVTLDTLGVVFSQCNAYARAASMFMRAVQLQPRAANMRFNLATALMFVGDLDAAEREYEACLALDPRYWKAHLALSQLRRQRPDSNHVERLQSLLATVEEPAGRLYVNLALEKELSDLGEHARSLQHLRAGKAAWRQTLDYDIRRDERIFDAVRRGFDAAPERPGHASREPFFILGMPRSGTTLVERILSSHSEVASAGELQNFGVMLKRLSASTTSRMLDEDTLARAAAVDPAELGRHYIESTRPLTGSTAHFIDKLPHNFLYAGFIARALPDAPLICLRRDPMDTTLGNFRQLFALSSPYYDYSFDLVDTARYYVLFDRLMAFWHERLPGRILEVRYEDVVRDQEAQTRRLLDHCGLAWDDACLAFEKNAAPVATASLVQVRSPIYATSIGRWKRYGNGLDDALAVLRDAGLVDASA
ncbi:tetratricopeptide repeat-containing sulfotransferase family protein [Luteimonas yindakuii]|uniref:tetratricopeptide repeat-containing sulfotransferase family protein n=1 Tax=Luteimonas yindakuii TaxID=2565782 RepID=UPI001FB6F235|nr:sulfotransferase [Luteimonas yindakuii]